MRRVVTELEERNVVRVAAVPVPDPSVLLTGMVATVIAVLPFLFTGHPDIPPPTNGMVDLAWLTAGLFLVVVYRGRGLPGESVE